MRGQLPDAFLPVLQRPSAELSSKPVQKRMCSRGEAERRVTAQVSMLQAEHRSLSVPSQLPADDRVLSRESRPRRDLPFVLEDPGRIKSIFGQ